MSLVSEVRGRPTRLWDAKPADGSLRQLWDTHIPAAGCTTLWRKEASRRRVAKPPTDCPVGIDRLSATLKPPPRQDTAAWRDLKGANQRARARLDEFGWVGQHIKAMGATQLKEASRRRVA